MFKGNVPIWALYALAAYFVTFVFIAGGLFLWWAKRRKERPPEKFKLLRGPGETQRRRVQKADENLFSYFYGGAFVPLVIVSLVLLLATQLPKGLVLVGAAVAAVLFFVSTVCAIVVLLRFLNR